jgi:beta-mannosidase
MTLSLDGRWQFRAIDRYGVRPAVLRKITRWMPAVVPGTVHTDLIARRIIPDPYFGKNELDVQWIENVQWEYRRTFKVTRKMLEAEHLSLNMEGLDTYAEIRINGVLAGKTSNMFIGHSFDIKRHLRRGVNKITILFDSPVVRSKQLEKRHGALRVALEPHRVYVRKAQYSFGWDWGPKLTTSGIWRSISIEASTGPRLVDPFVKILSANKHRAIAEVSVRLTEVPSRPLQLHVYAAGGGKVLETNVEVKKQDVKFRIEIPEPELWWPNGCGDQPMYTMVLSLMDDKKDCHDVQVNFACRTVKLVQEKDAEGRSFVIHVNGVPVFCKGFDWIPSDNFIPRIPDATYEKLLTLARDSHANMLRVWGGGIYEEEIFYDLCDRLGLMVWQDFMYACGEYPDTDWFRADAAVEAESAVKRLRNHPSIVIWCGNNECEWLFCTENPDKSPDAMRGSKIFHEILPSVCRKFDGTRPYWRSSPFGTGFPNAESNGNHHQWMVWSFWKDYPEYENDTARFVTEFGFQAPANRSTLEAVIPPADRQPQSPVMEHHNKQVEGPERLFRFQAAHYKVGKDFADFIYKGQLVQSEALRTAVEHWRRRKFRTAGSLIWQLNDCWPVSSWAVVDSSLTPKAAYYQMKRSFVPVLLSFRKTGGSVEVWCTNDRLSPVRGTAVVTVRSFNGRVGKVLKTRFEVPANSSRRIQFKASLSEGVDPVNEYLHGELVVGGKSAAENRCFLSEPKHLKLPAVKVTAAWKRRRDGSLGVRIRSKRFVKNLLLEVEGGGAIFSDNSFDLEAGSAREIAVESRMPLKKLVQKFRMRWLE